MIRGAYPENDLLPRSRDRSSCLVPGSLQKSAWGKLRQLEELGCEIWGWTRLGSFGSLGALVLWSLGGSHKDWSRSRGISDLGGTTVKSADAGEWSPLQSLKNSDARAHTHLQASAGMACRDCTTSLLLHNERTRRLFTERINCYCVSCSQMIRGMQQNRANNRGRQWEDR